MGSTASKPARAAGAAARRQYPKKASPSTTSRAPPPPRAPQGATAAPKQETQTKERASATRSEAIDLDARDPDFAASLRSIGPVIPNPTFSNSSTVAFNASQFSASGSQPRSQYPSPAANPALLTLAARANLSRAAEKEIEMLGRTGRASREGREFLDILTIKHILAMRDRQGVRPEVIERHFGLKEGVVARLGGRGVVGDVK